MVLIDYRKSTLRQIIEDENVTRRKDRVGIIDAIAIATEVWLATGLECHVGDLILVDLTHPETVFVESPDGFYKYVTNFKIYCVGLIGVTDAYFEMSSKCKSIFSHGDLMGYSLDDGATLFDSCHDAVKDYVRLNPLAPEIISQILDAPIDVTFKVK